MARTLQAPFPFVEAQELSFHTDPATTWAALAQDLAGAKQRIWLENYIFEDGVAADSLVAAFSQARTAGAEIRIVADAVGSFKMSRELRQRLEGLGIQIRIYNPIRLLPAIRHGLHRIFSRTHRRIIVIDDRIAWTGGMAVSDRWWPGGVHPPIFDTMLRMQGPLVEQMAQAFDALWNRSFSLVRNVIQKGDPGQARVIVQSPATGLHFRNDFYRRMAKTKTRLWLATPYFIPSVKFRRTLRKACQRGVDVRLLLPGAVAHDHPAVRYASRRYYTRLLVARARIFEYQPAFFHAKMALFDDAWTALGSANLDRWSFFFNHEVMVAARHEELAREVESAFEMSFADSTEITLQEWSRRSRWNRIKERFFGFFDRLF